MKPFTPIGVLAILACAALADGYTPRRNDTDPPFRLHKQELERGVEQVAVTIAGSTVPIGTYDTSSHTGVIAESIRVHKLPGTIPLLHIEWMDHLQGMGAYQNGYFLIAPAASPAGIYARGIVPLHGRWGDGTGIGGDYSVAAVSNTLTIVKRQTVSDTAASAKPLYHPVEEKGWRGFTSTVSTTLTRTYAIGAAGLTPLLTELRYVIQQGDTLDDVCSGLKVQRPWIQNPGDILHAGSNLVIRLPDEAAEKLYPTLDWREPSAHSHAVTEP